MSKLTVEDTSLTTVANAIRTKGGTTGALTFPDGFVNAVNGIKTGTNYLLGVVDGSLTNITAEMIEGCTKIRNYMFYYYSSLTSVNIPSSVTNIGDHAFTSCSSLTSVVIPPKVTFIGSYAF